MFNDDCITTWRRDPVVKGWRILGVLVSRQPHRSSVLRGMPLVPATVSFSPLQSPLPLTAASSRFLKYYFTRRLVAVHTHGPRRFRRRGPEFWSCPPADTPGVDCSSVRRPCLDCRTGIWVCSQDDCHLREIFRKTKTRKRLSFNCSRFLRIGHAGRHRFYTKVTPQNHST